MALTGKQRRYLRALAHPLAPVVQIGQRGVTVGLTAQVEQALADHELIKVKLTKECPLTVGEAGDDLVRTVGCDVAGTVGHVLILYRARHERPSIRLPGMEANEESTS